MELLRSLDSDWILCVDREARKLEKNDLDGSRPCFDGGSRGDGGNCGIAVVVAELTSDACSLSSLSGDLGGVAMSVWIGGGGPLADRLVDGRREAQFHGLGFEGSVFADVLLAFCAFDRFSSSKLLAPKWRAGGGADFLPIVGLESCRDFLLRPVWRTTRFAVVSKASSGKK